jgi:hypothetical protein
MTKRRLRGCPKLSPYGRLENELANAREALTIAATNYTDALRALLDTLEMLDASSFGAKTYRCLTPIELTRLEQIRKIARGPEL